MRLCRSSELAPKALQPLAKSVFDWTFVAHMSDFVSKNRLAHYQMPDAFLDEGRCAMHQAHLVFVHASRQWGLTSPLYSLHQGLGNATNKINFGHSLCRSAHKVCIVHGRPLPEAKEYRDWLL